MRLGRPWSRAAGGTLLAALLLTACSGTDGTVPDGDDAGTTTSAAPDPAAERAAYEEVMARLTGGADPAQGQLGVFWAAQFPAAFPDTDYEPVAGFQPFEESVETGCGPLGAGTAAFCIEDTIVYYDDDWLQSVHGILGDAGPTVVLAHEVGHHVAAQRGPRPEPVAAELQADCYAGRFVDGAFDGGALGLGTVAGGSAPVFLLGTTDPELAEWFTGELKGPVSWRTRAFLEGAVGGIDYCLAYDQWRAVSPLKVGPFSYLPSPATVTATKADGSLEVTVEDTRTIVGTVPRPGATTADAALPEVAAAWFDTDTPPLLGEPIAVGTHGLVPGTVAVQGYGYTDGSGEDRYGMMLVLLPGEGPAAVVSTSRPGAAPEPDDAAGWARVGEPMFVVGHGLCPTDSGAPVCRSG